MTHHEASLVVVAKGLQVTLVQNLLKCVVFIGLVFVWNHEDYDLIHFKGFTAADS